MSEGENYVRWNAKRQLGQLPRTSQIAERLGETAATVRFWCDQFCVPVLRSPDGHRMFDADSFTALSEVRRLLRFEGYTIAGAKKKLGIT